MEKITISLEPGSVSSAIFTIALWVDGFEGPRVLAHPLSRLAALPIAEISPTVQVQIDRWEHQPKDQGDVSAVPTMAREGVLPEDG